MTLQSRIKALFFDALDLPAPERAAFLDRACGSDAELRSGVERLLEADSHASDVLGTGSGLAVPGELSGAGASSELGPGRRIGPYVLEDELGSGGFGVVFRALQEEPVRRRVALKVVKLGMDTRSVIARFELERQALALMDHPNIARVFDAGATESGRPFFAMELVEGEPITDYCERMALGIEARVELFVRVARAVEHAHQRGVLHRDLKPSNVLVAEVDGEAQPKVIDFGIAKATGDPLTEASLQTREGLPLGTPTYMSPEQAAGALDIDTRTDVYSLGVLFYELISGLTPFDHTGQGLPAVFRAILEQEPPRPSTRLRQARASGETAADDTLILRDVPPELDWIVMRCLEKERERRYASAHDLADDAERFLRDEPLEAAPPSRVYRLRKLVRRHRTAALSLSAVVVALVLGTVGTSIGLLRADRLNVKLDAALTEATDANEKLDAALIATEAANEDLDLALEETRAANRQLDFALVEARRQTAIAEAVNAFLIQDLLGAARPTGAAGQGPATTIGTLLDIAATELDAASRDGGRFADQPLVEASLRQTIGTAYGTLGRPQEARVHLERCIELRGELLGLDDSSRLVALSYLGTVLRDLGQLQASAEALGEAFERLRNSVGYEDSETLMAAARLASVLQELDRGDEALELLEEALPIARAAQGEGGASVTDLGSALAILYSGRGRYAEAEEQFRWVLAGRLELLGPDSPVVLNTRTNLATTMRALGRIDESEAQYREILDVQRRVEGPEHPHTLNTLFQLAECLRQGERFEDAEAILAESLPVAEDVYGPEHRRTLLWLSTRAELLTQLGRHVEAESVYREAHARTREALGVDDPGTNEAAFALAQLLMLDPQYHAEAVELVEGMYASYARTYGAEQVATLQVQASLGAFYEAAGELHEAQATLEDVHAAVLRVAGPTSPAAAGAAVALAAVDAKLDAVDDAAVLLESASERVDLADPALARVRANWMRGAAELALAYRRADQDAEAERWERATP